MIKERYEKLTVVREYMATMADGKRERVSECKCDCGNFITVRTGNLKSGNTKSCGCSRQGLIKDMIGKRFGTLTVVSEGIHNNGVTWNCVCITSCQGRGKESQGAWCSNTGRSI